MRNPKKSGGVLCQGVAVRYAAAHNLRLNYPLRLACRLVRISTSGYYSWNKRHANEKSPERLIAVVKAAHQKTRGTYGALRLHKELLAEGHEMSLWKVKKIRTEQGLVLRRKRKFVRTTDIGRQIRTPNYAAFPMCSSWTFLAKAAGERYPSAACRRCRL